MAELSWADLQLTGKSIAAVQLDSGLIPWVVGGQADPWNHLEATMALSVVGARAAAERGFAWFATAQRADGSVPLKYVDGEVADESGDTNSSAYLAVAVWHHWTVWGDRAFVARYWPVVDQALNWVVSMQLPWGGIAWSQEWPAGQPGEVNQTALVAGSSSMLMSFAAGQLLAQLLGESRPTWAVAAAQLRDAITTREEWFADKSEFSMDWYYPVLGGAVQGPVALARLAAKWDEFVVPGLGVRCVTTNPWVTGAETCELALALARLGDLRRARQLFTDMQTLRDSDGSYWTGVVYPELVNWPVEQSTYTAAAVILAWQTLAGQGSFMPGQ